MSAPSSDPDFEHSDVVICPGGPRLVRGQQVVVDEDGVEHRTIAPISAVCRCGFTARAPWCDGTHKSLPDHLKP